MMVVKTTTVFYALRFLLGAFEAGFYPGVILYLTYWYPTSRRARTFGLFMFASAFAGVMPNYLHEIWMDYLYWDSELEE
jgi:MFS family permease